MHGARSWQAGYEIRRDERHGVSLEYKMLLNVSLPFSCSGLEAIENAEMSMPTQSLS